MKSLAVLALVAAIAAVATTTATASNIDDLRALGYTVGVQFQTETCTAWTVSGYGVSTSLGCEGTPDFQAAVDSIANPAGHCNRRWQAEHTDQLAALNMIGGKGWAVTGDQCADTYTVTDPSTGAVAYSGSGAGLVSLAATIAAPAPISVPAPPVEGAPTPVDAPPAGGGFCLPLCPSLGETRGAGGAITARAVAVAVPVSSDVRYVYEPATGLLTDTRLILHAGEAVAA